MAVVVFGGSAVGSFVEATHRLMNPEHHPQVGLTLAAVAVAAAIEGPSFGSLVRAANATRRPEVRWLGFISRSHDPGFPVLVIEDVSGARGRAGPCGRAGRACDRRRRRRAVTGAMGGAGGSPRSRRAPDHPVLFEVATYPEAPAAVQAEG